MERRGERKHPGKGRETRKALYNEGRQKRREREGDRKGTSKGMETGNARGK